MDRFTNLAVFARVVESGGFSAAARKLNMSTTSVSAHVQALEERLGARLLNRTTRRISLTEVGAAYYERAARILAELDEADRAAGALQATPRGTLRLHVSIHIARFVGPVVAEYLRLYPEAAVDLAIGDRVVDLVEEGYDLAIRTTPLPDSTLILRRLSGWRPFLCGAPAYIEAHAPPETLADLAAHNCLRFAYYPYGDEWRFTGPTGQPASVQVSGNLLSASAEVLRVAALEGLGLFLAPGFVIADDLESGRLVPILPGYRPVEFAINAIYPHRQHLSAKVRTFLDLVSDRIGQYGHWLQPDAPGPAGQTTPPGDSGKA